MGGSACEAADGATAPCTAGEGDCPANVNCAGSWSTCGADCADKTYTVETAQSGTGSACEAADGDTAPCTAGEGDRSVANVNCAGSWSICGADCADKTYTVETAQSGTGSACEAA